MKTKTKKKPATLTFSKGRLEVGQGVLDLFDPLADEIRAEAKKLGIPEWKVRVNMLINRLLVRNEGTGEILRFEPIAPTTNPLLYLRPERRK